MNGAAADAGNWIAVGSAELGQLLVWDWRQETYVLKQQGHSTHVAAVAFSPDGSQVATAGDDSKVRCAMLTGDNMDSCCTPLS